MSALLLYVHPNILCETAAKPRKTGKILELGLEPSFHALRAFLYVRLSTVYFGLFGRPAPTYIIVHAVASNGRNVSYFRSANISNNCYPFINLPYS